MHKLLALLTALLALFLLLIFLGESDNRQEKKTPKPTLTPVVKKKMQLPTFALDNNQSEHYEVTLTKEKIRFSPQKKPIVLVQLFATWCPPCMGQIENLKRLQKAYKQNLFVASILTEDTMTQEQFKAFYAKYEINYFISTSSQNNRFALALAKRLHLGENYPIPLTILLVNGEYFTHYEGSVLREMIAYDIEQAQKMLELTLD